MVSIPRRLRYAVGSRCAPRNGAVVAADGPSAVAPHRNSNPKPLSSQSTTLLSRATRILPGNLVFVFRGRVANIGAVNR